MPGTGFFTTGSPGIVAPESIGPLIIEPLSQQSVALRVSNVVPCSTKDYRFPKIVSRPLAHWVAEGQPLTEEDPSVDEEICTPKKLTALVKISREMASDSISPGAAAIVGQAVVEQIQRQIDQAYFGSNVADPNQPAGLEDLQGHQNIDIEGPFLDFAWAVKAESLLNQVGATATAFVANASTIEVLATLREFQETTTVKSNEFLLSPDPTQATKYAVNGTPLFWVPDDVIEPGTVGRCAVRVRTRKPLSCNALTSSWSRARGRISPTTVWRCARCCATGSRGRTRLPS